VIAANLQAIRVVLANLLKVCGKSRIDAIKNLKGIAVIIFGLNN
jgi:hypothetical protein